MDRRYWDNAAADYDGQIHDSLRSDRTGVIRKRLLRYSEPGTIAGDFGCGVGKYVPLLARRFAAVYAIDLSPKLLEQARIEHGHLDHVRFIEADLARGKPPIPRCDFALCTNVLIVPDAALRRAIMATIRARMKPGAHLLSVVPSTESALYVSQRLVEWNRRAGEGETAAYRESLDALGRDVRRVIDGVVSIDGVATKHYLAEELAVMCDTAGFDLIRSDKVEYGWDTEFADPPKWMGRPYPWDWLLVARRR